MSGVVSDSHGETLVGVSIYEKSDPSKGIVTDYEGKYKTTVTAGDVLVFSYIGFNTREIKVGIEPNQFINVETVSYTHLLW